MKTIPEILRDRAGLWPDRAALVVTRGGRDREISYARLASASEAFAGRLARAGIRRGDAVLIFVPMSAELYVALFGALRLGATAMFVDPSSGVSNIEACCRKHAPSALVAAWPLRVLRPFVSGLRRIPRVFAPPGWSTTSRDELPPFPGPDDAALITFTSGSTGTPKAAVRTHRFLLAQHRALEHSIALEEGERDLTTLPVFVLANLASGVTSILPDAKISRPGFVNGPRLARQIHRLRPTRSGGSPAFYLRVAEVPGALAAFRKIYTGGAPVFPSTLQRLREAAPDAAVVAVYGSTEAEPVAHVECGEIRPEDWQAMRAGGGLLAGKPIPEIRLRIVADQWGGPLTDGRGLPCGEAGEIIVTGEHVLKGYLHGEGDEETKVRLDGEIWHRTGDAGYLDASGRLWLLGRCAARVKDASGVLYPFAVECVAMSFPSVRRAAFVSHRERRVLVIEGSLDREERSSLEQAVAWAGVGRIWSVDRIPVDARHNAKVNYPKLRTLLERLRK
jgi:Acyl-CoA synthetases (AMP-forming)/AMP-acid ligases II